jgi:hypothetical protein
MSATKQGNDIATSTRDFLVAIETLAPKIGKSYVPFGNPAMMGSL